MLIEKRRDACARVQVTPISILFVYSTMLNDRMFTTSFRIPYDGIEYVKYGHDRVAGATKITHAHHT